MSGKPGIFSRILSRVITLALLAIFTLIIIQPLSIYSQGVFALMMLGLVIVLYHVRPQGYRRFLRLLFLLSVALIAGRYVVWRVTTTLPSPEDPLAMILGLALFAAEAYTIMMVALNFFVISDPIRRLPAPLPEDTSLWPTVDVYIPTYNEDPELVAHTVRAAVAMDYPKDKFTVYLLDDGGTEQKLSHPDNGAAAHRRAEKLKALCRRLGAVYMTRERNEHAKAGNMNAAFSRTTGDLIAVFDADHVPTREFLKRTVGYFVRDKKAFLVQTPHAFISPDPIEKNLKLSESMPGENEMFYALVQPGLDRWGASFFCGSAALLSRAALNESGGFSGKSVTEDAETAITLHSRGWRSYYVDEPLITGLQPETFAGFVGQRSRWLQGMIQIFLFKNPLLIRGLSLAQRICYLSIQLFWLFPAARVVFFFAPLVFLFFGVGIYVATIQEFLVYAVPYLIAMLTLGHACYGHLRRPFMSDLYEAVQSVYLIKALVGVLIRPFAPTFNVTDKGETIDEDDLSHLVTPFVLMTILLIAGECVAAWKFFANPDVSGVMIIVGAFNTFNLALALAALGVMCERRQRRKYPRLPANMDAQVKIGDRRIDARIEDLSVRGASLVIDAQIATIDVGHLTLHTPNGDHIPLRIVSKSTTLGGTRLGCALDDRSEEVLQAWSALMYGSNIQIKEFLAKRRIYRSAFIGTLAFFRLSLSGLLAFIRIIVVRALRRRQKEESSRPQPQTESL